MTTMQINDTGKAGDIRGMSMPALLIRLEGLAVLLGSIALYAHLHGNGWLFVLLLLAPDLSMLGYMAGPRAGAITYDLVHTYAGPLALGVIALLMGWTSILLIALIWIAHIGMDRIVGYGLKYLTDFKDTHLGRV